MKITATHVRVESTGLMEVTAHVEERKNPYTMHVIVVSTEEGSWEEYTITSDFGVTFNRAYSWTVADKSPERFKKLAVCMFESAVKVWEANKPEPQKEDESNAE